MKPSHIAIVGVLHAKEKPDVFLDASGILRALMMRDARIWAARTDRSENAIGAPDPSDADARIEAAKLAHAEKRAARIHAARIAAGLTVRPRHIRRVSEGPRDT
jgi:hypothetical protein